MNIFTKVFSVIIFALVVASCETTSPFYKDFVQTIPPISGDSGRIFFYDGGADARRYLFLNGEIISNKYFDDWRFFYLDRPPGEYEVKICHVGWFEGAWYCNEYELRDSGCHPQETLSFKLEKGEEKYVHISLKEIVCWKSKYLPNFRTWITYPELVDKAEAVKELEDINMQYLPESLR